MKKALLTILMMGLVFSISAQQRRGQIPAEKQNIEAKAPVMKTLEHPAIIKEASLSSTKAGLAPTEATIGETRYDLQTNASVQNRLYLYPDGTIGGTWTYGMTSAFSERGTGYNYFDGTSWGAYPTARIETVRTGWPSYAPWGTTGECVLAHTGGTGLAFNTRATKGSGSWTQSILPYPPGHATYWPRMTTSGANHDNVHIITLTDPTASGGVIYAGMDGALLYSRSQDGGQTWDIQDSLLPGMTAAEYVGFGGDQYAWAEPKGNTLAFVVGDNWTDLFIMKSTDGGDTWTKTMIFAHPYPMFDEATTLVTDTPWVCDGGTSIAIDDNGDVHVAFGLMRVMNDVIGDDQTSYFPYTDGLAYWKEGDPAFTTLHIDSVDARGSLIGFMIDLSGNDTIDFLSGDDVIGLYYLGLSSMPNITVDEQGSIFVVYSGLTEGRDNGVQMFRHIWSRAKLAGETEWSEFIDLTGSIIHNFDECVFPTLAANTGSNHIHLIYQADEEPGLHIRGDEDAPTDNSIIHNMMPKQDYVGLFEQPNPVSFVSQNFPNPFSRMSEVIVRLERSSTLQMEVFNLVGQKVISQEEGKVSPGYHTFHIDGSRLQSGIYFYTVTAGTHSVTKKMIVQ